MFQGKNGERSAQLMHISEGFLSPRILVAGAVIAGAGVAWGLKKMDSDRIVRAAMASSVFFLASLINVKVGPSSTHLSLIGPIGLLMGWSSFPVIFTALLLQAVLFQFGGLLVLGANTASMGSAAVIAYLLFGRAVRGKNLKVAASASFAAGFFAVLLGAIFVGIWLVSSDPGMTTAAEAIVIIHLPLAAVEGAVAMFMTAFLNKTFPNVLSMAEK